MESTSLFDINVHIISLLSFSVAKFVVFALRGTGRPTGHLSYRRFSKFFLALAPPHQKEIVWLGQRQLGGSSSKQIEGILYFCSRMDS
jgi:hypothetical protein